MLDQMAEENNVNDKRKIIPHLHKASKTKMNDDTKDDKSALRNYL